MFRSRFFWQLYAGYFAAVALCAVIAGLNLASWAASEARQRVRDSLLSEAALLEEIARPVFSGGGTDAFQERVRALGTSIGTRLTVMDARGVVLADSSEDPAGMDNHGARPEIQEARHAAIGSASRFSDTLERDMLYIARRVDGPAAPIGFVRTSLPVAGIDEKIGEVRALVFQSAFLAALVALAIGLVGAHRITARIASMTEVAGQIAAGDYARRVPATGTGEVARLARAFNAMAEQMEARIAGVTEGRNTLGTILSGMVEGVVAVDLEERIVHMNAVAGDLLEVDPADSAGERIREVTRVTEVAAALKGAIDAGDQVRNRAHLVGSGEDRQVELTASPLRSANGELTGAVVVLQDVTEMRRLEGVRREFVANASHELKTPITAIRGFLETLVADPDMDAETRAGFLARASAQSERLSALVTDLLQLSRLETGAGLAATEPVDLCGVVRQTVGELLPVAESKGIEVLAELPEEKALVRGETSALALILDNLVTNAIKYTDAGGHVRVELTLRGSHVVLEVGDDGIGIDRVHLDRIFERFYRVDKARSRELGGTGLGLAIVKHACGVLNGTLSVESKLGVGSTFRVRLPRVRGERPVAAS